MAITKVWLDESKVECTKCGLCESLCPEVFIVPDKMVVKPDADLSKEPEIKEAADCCPVHVIAIECNNSKKETTQTTINLIANVNLSKAELAEKIKK